VSKLVALIEQKIAKQVPADKPALRVVAPAKQQRTRLDAITRESHLRMVRSLRKHYKAFGFEILVNQATIGKADLDDLDDDELIALHRDLDRARECLNDGITFEEAGLIRSHVTA
jgi:hypothetical protein